MSFNCPHCAAALSVEPQQAGQITACPYCHGQFRAPASTAGSQPPYPQSGFSGKGHLQNVDLREANSKKMAAGICGILLNGLGIHKFILGYHAAGTIMVVVYLVCIVTGACLLLPIVGSLAMSVIGVIEGIIYLTKTDEEFYHTYMVNRREWF